MQLSKMRTLILATITALGVFGSVGSASAAEWERGGRMANGWSGKCLTPYGGSSANGAQMVQWDCNANHAQIWYQQDDGSIVNASSRKCLTPYGGSGSNGANIVQWDCNGKPEQRWLETGSVGISLINEASGKCLTIYGSSSGNGVNAVQWSCENSNRAHRWGNI